MDNSKQIDIDVLISEVYKRTPIWSREHRDHFSRPALDKLWREISVAMKEEEHILRKKWKYLRDQYAIELGKRRRHPVTADAPCKWRYFTLLSFLKESVKPRRVNIYRKRRVPSPSIETEIIENFKGEVPDTVMMSMPGSSCMDSNNEGSETEAGDQYADPFQDTMSTSVLENYQEEQSDTFDESLIEIEKLRTPEEDEHIMFFRSLLPHVRKIPQSRILSFRNRIMEVVDQYAYQAVNSSVSVPCTSISSTSADNQIKNQM